MESYENQRAFLATYREPFCMYEEFKAGSSLGEIASTRHNIGVQAIADEFLERYGKRWHKANKRIDASVYNTTSVRVCRMCKLPKPAIEFSPKGYNCGGCKVAARNKAAKTKRDTRDKLVSGMDWNLLAGITPKVKGHHRRTFSQSEVVRITDFIKTNPGINSRHLMEYFKINQVKASRLISGTYVGSDDDV